MAGKQKLELTWIGKENRPRLEPRILLEDPAKSYHAPHRVSENDIFDNRLIFGDNLLALKALEQEFTGKVKCIYIDPPYNTGDAMPHYDDGLEHSTWLSLMRDRFEILRKLLTNDGVFFCQLNDDELAYAKVLLDEVFGRRNFLNQVSVKMKQTAGASGGGEDKRLKKNIEYILIYAKDRDGDGGFARFNEVFDEEDLFEVIEEMRAEGKSWKYTRILKSFGRRQHVTQLRDGSGEPIEVFRHSEVEVVPISQQAVEEGISEEECYVKYFDKIFRDTNAQTSIRTRVMDAVAGTGDFFSIDYTPKSGRNKGVLTTMYYKGRNCDLLAWLSDISVKKGDRIVKLEKAGTFWDGFPLNNLTKEGGVQFPHGKKPEALIKKVLDLCTSPGDLVLDSFAGSGTTAAVAHKMGRKWITVELGEHCHSHVLPRLRKVIDGEDRGGISPLVTWKGGGGFRYYSLAPSLLKEDAFGNWVISKEYNPAMLAEAVCKLEGFHYAPSDEYYWQHGHSTEADYIFVTTQTLSREQLQKLNDEVGPNRSLLVCCGAYRTKKLDDFPQLTVKKIPKAVMQKCEWGKDDYSLEIKALPDPRPTESTPVDPVLADLPKNKRKARKLIESTPSLFSLEELE
jgi:adenine-specific DNA-methyltransferase